MMEINNNYKYKTYNNKQMYILLRLLYLVYLVYLINGNNTQISECACCNP